MIPDRGGIAERVRRAVATRISDRPRTEVSVPGYAGGRWSRRHRAGRSANGRGRGEAIVVLGGDGTQRLVAGACGEVPIVPLSTGTNNVFPESREATIAGLATGLVATGKIPAAEATVRNKILRLEIDGVHERSSCRGHLRVRKPLGGIEGAMAPGRSGPDFCRLCRIRRDWTVIRGGTHPACLPACASWPAHRFGAPGTGESSLCSARLRPG